MEDWRERKKNRKYFVKKRKPRNPQNKVTRKVEGKLMFFETTVHFHDGTKIPHKSVFVLERDTVQYREKAYHQFIEEVKLIRYEYNKNKENDSTK